MGNTVGSQRNLTKHQKEILIGILLGDGHLEKRWKNARLRIEHGLSQKDYNDYYNKFYRNKRKRIPGNIKEMLESPLSLAVWYMDDGYKRNDCNRLRINTDCYRLREQKLLQRCLKENFGISTKLHRKGKDWNIYIPATQSRKFCRIIKPYILPKLKYKISLTP